MIRQADKIRRYYNSTATDYRFVWSGKDMPLHFGYYDESVANHRESLSKMNEVVAKQAGIKKSDRVLDAGCGYGASCRWLAREFGCRVVGLTIVPRQIKKAQELTKEAGLSSKVTFRLEDYTKTSFADKSFDVVWGLESILHAENKYKFIKEAFRLLKRKGRIVIAEYILQENLGKEDKKLIDKWMSGWAMPGVLTVNENQKLLIKAGFKNIIFHDISDNVARSIRRLGKMSKISLPIAKIFYKLKIFNRERYRNLEVSLLHYKIFGKGLWKYMVVTAEKK